MGLDTDKVFLCHTLFNLFSPFSILCSVPSPPLPHFVQSPLPLYHTLFNPLSPFTTLCSVPSPPLPHFVQSPLLLYHTLFSPLSHFTTLCSVPSPSLPHFVQSPLPFSTLCSVLPSPPYLSFPKIQR